MAVTYRAADVRGLTFADAWRSFRTAIGLGWAIESNWSDPFLFAVYTIAKPLAAALILVVMFQVITGGQGTEFLQFMIVGSALWNVVFGVMGGMVQSILEDRERYRMMKYVVVTPTSLFPFLIGRSLARVLISMVAVVLTLLVGVVFLGVVLQPNLPYLVLGQRARPHRGDGARHRHGRLVPPAAPGGVALPGGDRRRALPRLRRDLPDRHPARASCSRSPTRCPPPGGSRHHGAASSATGRRARSASCRTGRSCSTCS